MIENNIKPLLVISGGTGYLGGVIASRFGENGWRVATLGRTVDTDSDLAYSCDVTDEESVKNSIQKIIETYGQIGACIHAATLPVDAKTPILSTSVDSFDAQIAVATRGAFLLAKHIIPSMPHDSAFIGITSALIEPNVVLSPTGGYISAKYALRGFLRSLASEVASKGIRVYAVAPGFLPGGLNKGLPDAIIKFLGKKSGVGDATPEDVADVVLRMCVEPASYAPGSSVSVPGGISPL